MSSLHDVTIIIPIYVKTEAYLDYVSQCVQSAVEQGCHVLMLDDGSPIDPRPTLAKFANKTRLLMRDENKGVGHTRNQLVRNVTTELILPLDSDDMLIPGAVGQLIKAWTGKPVYPDIEMFGERNTAHYELKDFSCKNLENAVGLAPVSVLHSKEQWEAIGGWNETVELYEDGEYNARLFSQFCAVRLSKPLLRYRQHTAQRSKHPNGRQIARDVHRKYILAEVLAMARGCCGKSKTSTQPTVQAQATRTVSPGGRPNMFYNTAQSTALPGVESDRIKARYVGGKGKGPHYYKGTGTGYRYKVVHGQIYYVDAKDAAFSETQIGLGNNRSLFRALEEPKEAAPSTFQTSEDAPKKDSVERTARVDDVERTPVTKDEDLPDLYAMNVSDVEDMEDLTSDMARRLLVLEKKGKNRVGVRKHLEKFIDHG